MPGGFFRGLAKAAADEYMRVRAEQKAREQQQYTQHASYTPPAGSLQQSPQFDSYDVYDQPPPPLPSRPSDQQQQTLQYCSTPPAYSQSQSPAGPQPYPAYTPTSPTKQPTVQTNELPPATPQCQAPQPHVTNACKPAEPITCGQGFTIPTLPDLDVCPYCYNLHVASSPFAPLFKSIAYPPNNQRTCSLGIHGIKTHWLDACGRLGSDSTPQEQQILLDRFNKTHNETFAQLEALLAQVNALNQEIQIMQLQQQYQQKSAMMQIMHGATQNSIASMDLSNTTRIVNPGSVGMSIGNARFAEAGQMGVNVEAKRMQLEQVARQARILLVGMA